jgi:alcohol-forming fatty acyl-CoA reductase
LREFPGVPEGVVDVIPVDLVVATIIAVAAVGGSPGDPSVYQVASGARNPLRYGEMVSIIRGWFAENPLYDSRGQPILVPEWSFPGRGRVQGQLRRATVALSAAERVANALPIRGQWADRASRIEERRVEAERALEYVELYGAYIESEARFRVDRTLALAASLDPADRAEFQIDPAVIEWSHYLRDVHVPSVVEHARVRTDPGRRSGESRADRLRRGVLTSEPRCAVFDLENTLIASNVVESYAWLATRHVDLPERGRVVAGLLAEAPRLLALDRRDRADFLRYFYRRYEGAPAERIRADSYELFDDLILTRAFPAGIARVRRHRELGHPTLLITGALDFVIEPLRPLFDEVICASLGESDGALTGQLTATPPTGEARTIVMDEWARSRGLTLEQTVSYADSTSDLPMLEAAGHPVAVNPEAKLATIARRRGWLIENWQRARGGPRKPLAISTRTRGIRSPLAPPPDAGIAGIAGRTSLEASSRNGALR